ncbi:hypothetical protein LDK41_03870 [Lactiplantibacillus plantarum]|uniref:hypothetical protein n=1 Tax=Lactiplantibacillus plantarum TaxID=1590 RepID=UPI0022375F41|nr:hypothetical protein [Lactiplantibacillus plantarum]MCW6126207.1 hypothetical protein [Lactiplantibacillus plantarum]
MATVRFENKRVNMSKLSQFGFEPNQNGQYQFRTLIMQGQFEMIIELNTDGSLNTTLTDTTTSEVYVLHLTSQAHGQFVGQVAQAYQDVLYNIEQHCYDNDVFQSTPERKSKLFMVTILSSCGLNFHKTRFGDAQTRTNGMAHY